MGIEYAAVRDAIKDGDLISTKHTSWRSWYDWQIQLVQTATQSKYAHVAQVCVIGDRRIVLEAVSPLVRMVPLRRFAKEGFFWVPMDAPMSSEEMEKAMGEVAEIGYSKWQAVLAYFKRLKLGKDRKTECAEYVITNRRLSGVDLGDVATPAAVVQAAMDMGKPVFWVQDR